VFEAGGVEGIHVSSGQGRRTPAKLFGVSLVQLEGSRRRRPLGELEDNVVRERHASQPLTRAAFEKAVRRPIECINVLDSGSATSLAGETEADEWVTSGFARYVEPLPSSIRRIRGIGALNDVVHWLAFTLDFGGAPVTFSDVPVLRGHRGLLLGNDFLHQGRANIQYAGDEHGTVCLRDSDNTTVSTQVPFRTTQLDGLSFAAVHADGEAAEVFEATDFGDVSAEERALRYDEQAKAWEVEEALKEVKPIAWAPSVITIPPWSEAYFRVRVPETLVKARDVLLLPLEDDRQQDLGVLIAPTLQKVTKDGYAWCRAINTGKTVARIPLLAPVARFQIDPRVYSIEHEFSIDEIIERIHVGENLAHDDRQRICKMLATRRALFRSKLGYAHGYKMKLRLPAIEQGLAKPPNAAQRLRSNEEEAALDKEITKQLKAGLIEPARSPYNSLPMLIKKPTKEGEPQEYRTVLDYRGVNAYLEKDVYPLPNLETNLSALGKANWFTCIDLLQGFHQLELEDDGVSKEATAFSSKRGQFQWVRMPMGLASSPSTFMRLVDSALRGLPPGTALAYVDDLVIPTSGTFQEHLDDVGKVFDRLIEAGFAVRCDKCHIGLKSVPYLGFMVGTYGTKPMASKTKAIVEMAIKHVIGDPAAAARFAGMMGFYSKFVPDLHSLLGAFHELKAKAAPIVEIIGGPRTPPSLRFIASFAACKLRLATATANVRPDFTKKFYLHVDAASSCGIGGVLMQRTDEDDPDSLVPLAFWSRRLTEEERVYGVRDQECMALKETLVNYRHILLGHRTVALSDHASLQWLLTTKHRDTSRVSDYALYAQSFDLTVEWIKGSLNVVADCLSRATEETQPSKEGGPTGGRADLAERLEASEDPSPGVQAQVLTNEMNADWDDEAFSGDAALDTGGTAQPTVAAPTALDAEDTGMCGAVSQHSGSKALVEMTESWDDETFSGDAALDVSDGEQEGQTSATTTGAVGGSTQETGVFLIDEDVNIRMVDVKEACKAIETVVCKGLDTDTYFTRKSPTVGLALLQVTTGGLRVLVEEHDGVLVLPRALTTAQKPTYRETLTYRAQLLRSLHLSYGPQVETVLRKAVKFKARADGDCNFFATVTDDSFTTKAVGNFLALDERLLATLGDPEDRAFVLQIARILSVEQVDTKGARSRWKGGVSLLVRQLAAVKENGATACASFSVQATSATSSVQSLPTVIDKPAGPAFCESSEHGRRAIDMLAERLQKHPHLSLAIDLEGMLGGRRGHVDLIQLCVDGVSEKEPQLVYVLDAHNNGAAFFEYAPMRRMLEDKSVRKVLHCAYGDASALYYEYDIKVSGILDTAVADCLLRDSPPEARLQKRQQRKLNVILTEHLGDTIPVMTHKSTHVHKPGQFQQRPLPLEYFEYAYEDVLYLNKLHDYLCAELEAEGLLQLAHELSEMRAPPRALPKEDNAHWPAKEIVVVFGDARSVVCMQTTDLRKGGEPSLAFPSAPLHSQATADSYREQALTTWSTCMGETDKPTRALFANRLRKLVRVGDTLVAEVVVKDCTTLISELRESIKPLHEGTTIPVVRPRVNFTNPSCGVLPEQRAVFQHVHWEASRMAVVNVAAGPKTTSERAAIIVHDNKQVYCLTTDKKELQFPQAAIEVGGEAKDAAMKAFDVFAGPALRKHDSSMVGLAVMPESSRRIREGFDNMTEIGVCGNVTFFSCFVAALSDLTASFCASRSHTNGFRLVPTLQKRYPGYGLYTHSMASGRLAADHSSVFSGLTGVSVAAVAQHSGFNPRYQELHESWDDEAFSGDAALATLDVKHSIGEWGDDEYSGDAALECLAGGESASGDLDEWDACTFIGDASLSDLATTTPEQDDASCWDESWRAQYAYDAEFEATGSTEQCEAGQGGEQSGVDEEEETLFEAACLIHYAELLAETTECEATSLGSEGVSGTMGTVPLLCMPTTAEVLAAQRAHPAYADWISYLELGEWSDAWINNPRERVELVEIKKVYELDQLGLLRRLVEGTAENPVVLPPCLRHRVLHQYHDRMGHFGVAKVLKLMSRRFYWGTVEVMQRTISGYIKSCDVCQRTKIPGHKAGEGHVASCGHHPGDVLCGDVFDVGFEEDGYDHTLDFACYFSRGIRSVPLKGTPTSETIIDALISVIFRDSGIPSEIRSDAGSNFISAAVRLLYERLGIEIVVGTAYRHHLVGLVERWHRTLLQLIKSHKLARKEAQWGSKWYRCLPLMELAYNLTVNQSTGYSPFFLQHLREGRMPTDLNRAAYPELPKEIAEWVQDRLDDLNVVYEAASHSLRLKALHAKKTHDLKHDVGIWFKPGDKVLLVKGTAYDAGAVHPKIQVPTDGPFTIRRALPFDRYLLSDLTTRRIRSKIHVDRLLPYFGRVSENDSKWKLSTDPSGGVWPVNSIVGRRLTTVEKPITELGIKEGEQIMEYKIRWTGFQRSSDKWRAVQYLGEVMELINEYNKGHPLNEAHRAFLALQGESVDRIDRPALQVPVPSAESRQRKHMRSRPHVGERPAEQAEQPATQDAVELGPPVEEAPGVNELDKAQQQLTTSLARLPVGARVRTHYRRDGTSFTGTVQKSWVPRRRSAGKPLAHHVTVIYDDPRYGGEAFEHNVQNSEIEVIEAPAEPVPDKATVPTTIDEKAARRLARIRRELQ
tara:strand:+ start:9491 stop:17443 length:7953 start_codon:yes stop_codon:yes gene_type:complete